MGKKARRLKLLGFKKWYLYYDYRDAKEIDTWDELKATQIWNQLKKEILNYYSNGLSASTCPWCIGFGCSECKYKERHYRCSHFDSDFTNITKDAIEQWGDIIYECMGMIYFSNKWYRKIIKEIENEIY